MTQIYYLIDEQCYARDGWDYQPGGVKGKPSKIETHFLSIIIRDEVQGLHKRNKVTCKETPSQAKSITRPTLLDLFFEIIMHWEVINNDTYFLITNDS